MPETQEQSRNIFLMKLATVLTGLLLLVPLFFSWRFNLSHDAVWFLRAALFVVLAQVLVWRLCLHIREDWLRKATAIALVEALAIYAAGRLVSFYYQGESYNEEFFFHFNLETLKFALGAFPVLIVIFFAYLLLAGTGAYFSIFHTRALPLGNRTLLIIPVLLAVLSADPDIATLATSGMRDANTRDDMQLSTIDWDGLGLDRNALYRMSDDIVAGKNVVMIYLEGLDKMYTEESLFPGLTPFLSSLKDNGLFFDNMAQTRGTTFTVAGILSSQCGTPLVFPNGPGGNDILKNGFLQQGFCFGDILKSAGYHQVFMGGASTRFAGKGVFLSAHGYDEVLGKEELRPRMADRDYLNNWGLYDDTLLELAADKFDELAANSDQPFNFSVLTVDTHPPDGTVSASCKPYDAIDNNIFHAVHCTDQLVERFVDHLSQSPAWDDTVVLVMSDHLHMRNTGMDFYPPDYERKLFVAILNGGETGVVSRPGTHMDVAPTLLSLMNVQHQQAFLAGRDLLAPETADLVVDPDNGRRIAAIRYINTNLLSRIEVGLCEADPLYSYEGNTLRVAGREIDLSIRGRPMPLNTLGTSNALLTLVNNEGRVGLTFPVNLRNLAYVLYQFRTSNFLLLTPSAPIQTLYPELPSWEGLGMVFGNVQDNFQVLQTGLGFTDEGFTVQADCGELLAQSRALTPEGVDANLGKICNNTTPEGTFWQESRGLITLNSVAYANLRYQATLRRNDRGWYAVTSLNELPSDPEEWSCDAYYGNQEILIPGIETETGPASMILKKIPGVTLTFELGTITPLPTE